MKKIMAIPVTFSLMVFCFGTVWAGPQNPPSAPVTVVNPPTKPVPVTGPATKLIFHAEHFEVDPGRTTIADVDVSACSKIRILAGVGSECTTVTMMLTMIEETDLLGYLDTFTFECPDSRSFNRVYDLPGTLLRISVEAEGGTEIRADLWCR